MDGHTAARVDVEVDAAAGGVHDLDGVDDDRMVCCMMLAVAAVAAAAAAVAAVAVVAVVAVGDEMFCYVDAGYHDIYPCLVRQVSCCHWECYYSCRRCCWCSFRSQQVVGAFGSTHWLAKFRVESSTQRMRCIICAVLTPYLCIMSDNVHALIIDKPANVSQEVYVSFRNLLLFMSLRVGTPSHPQSPIAWNTSCARSKALDALKTYAKGMGSEAS